MRVETEIRFKMGLTLGVRAVLHSYAFETLPIRQNLAGHRSKMLSRRPEAAKHRWASLQIAFEASLERQNLAGHRSKSLSKRPRNAKTSLGIAPNCFRSAPETPKHRWASLRIVFEALETLKCLCESHRIALGTISKRQNAFASRTESLSGRSRSAKMPSRVAQNRSRSGFETLK